METQQQKETANADGGKSLSNGLLASIPFTEERGIRFHERAGTAEHNGETIELLFDLGGGVCLTYKGKRYRFAPEDIIGSFIDAIDGTVCGS